MNQLYSIYKNKYLKYKNKYLNLKYGGIPKYVPPYVHEFAKNFYVYIKEDLYLDLSFKDKLVANLKLAGYNPSPKESASIVYIDGHDKYPVKDIGESEDKFRIRKIEHQQQFKHVQMINVLWGEFKEIITYKLRFQENFINNKIIKKYMPNWHSIKKDTRNEDISKIIFEKDEIKVLKAERGYSSFGTKLVRNKEDVLKHIEEYDNRPLIFDREHTHEIKANNWIIENFINSDKIEDRKFFLRVHILVTSIHNNIKVYISNIHPYGIMKRESTDLLLSHTNIDNVVGAHLKKYSKKGGGFGTEEEEDGTQVIYDIDRNPHWPKDLPDGYNEIDKLKINKDLNELFINIFSNLRSHKLKPDFNSPNGFEIFGCDISLENKNVMFHEINRRTGLIIQAPFIGDIIKVYKYKDDFEYFTRII
jgi:hypothetical protein